MEKGSIVYENKKAEIFYIIFSFIVLALFAFFATKTEEGKYLLITIAVFLALFIFIMFIRISHQSRIVISQKGIVLHDVNKKVFIPHSQVLKIKKLKISTGSKKDEFVVIGICLKGSSSVMFTNSKSRLVKIYTAIEALLQWISFTDYEEISTMFTQNKKLSGCDITIPPTFNYDYLLKKLKIYFPNKVEENGI